MPEVHRTGYPRTEPRQPGRPSNSRDFPPGEQRPQDLGGTGRINAGNFASNWNRRRGYSNLAVGTSSKGGRRGRGKTRRNESTRELDHDASTRKGRRTRDEREQPTTAEQPTSRQPSPKRARIDPVAPADGGDRGTRAPAPELVPRPVNTTGVRLRIVLATDTTPKWNELSISLGLASQQLNSRYDATQAGEPIFDDDYNPVSPHYNPASPTYPQEPETASVESLLSPIEPTLGQTFLNRHVSDEPLPGTSRGQTGEELAKANMKIAELEAQIRLLMSETARRDGVG